VAGRWPPQAARLLRLGLADAFMAQVGNQAAARARYGLTPPQIAAAIINFGKDEKQ
jgi:deoxyxylulose-5-phosphate synthase